MRGCMSPLSPGAALTLTLSQGEREWKVSLSQGEREWKVSLSQGGDGVKT